MTPTDRMTYPGGEDAPGYRLAFQAWMLLFLGTICVGLLIYLGGVAKRWTG
jgi:hypothetical protein